MKSLSLIKGPHRYHLTYEEGDEAIVLDHLEAMVHNPELPFDWFDAALLAHQVGRQQAETAAKWMREAKEKADAARDARKGEA